VTNLLAVFRHPLFATGEKTSNEGTKLQTYATDSHEEYFAALFTAADKILFCSD